MLGADGMAAAGALDRDPIFPGVGSSAYDATHYDVRLAYQPHSGQLRATVAIEARAREALRRIGLDLAGLRVTAVRVDGVEASFRREGRKLLATPVTPLAAGRAFTVTVRYRGRPRAIFRRNGTVEGWFRTGDGALTIGESIGTATWLPCNERLTDKATFDFHLTVPSGLRAASNGRLRSVRRDGGRSTYSWREAQPMAAYLAVVNIGRARLQRSRIGRLPVWTMVDSRLPERRLRALDSLPSAIRFFSRAFGPYPFDSAGSIVDRTPIVFALESQTRPIYGFLPERQVVVHETAHQWFGDSVGIARWSDIWLNEGLTTWAQWYYAEHHGGPTTRATFRRLLRENPPDSPLWQPPPGRPQKASDLFVPSIYVRGALAVEALRLEVGTPTLLKILRRWTAEHRHGAARIGEFIALAEELSDRDLQPLFNRWLYASRLQSFSAPPSRSRSQPSGPSRGSLAQPQPTPLTP